MLLLQQVQTINVQQVHTVQEVQRQMMLGAEGSTFMQRMDKMTQTITSSTTTNMSQQLLAMTAAPVAVTAA